MSSTQRGRHTAGTGMITHLARAGLTGNMKGMCMGDRVCPRVRRGGLAGSWDNLKQIYGTGRALSSAKLDKHVAGVGRLMYLARAGLAGTAGLAVPPGTRQGTLHNSRHTIHLARLPHFTGEPATSAATPTAPHVTASFHNGHPSPSHTDHGEKPDASNIHGMVTKGPLAIHYCSPYTHAVCFGIQLPTGTSQGGETYPGTGVCGHARLTPG